MNTHTGSTIRPKPGKVQAIGAMVLGGGIVAVVAAIVWALSTMCVWIPWVYSLVIGILAIIQGAKLIGDDAYLAPPPKTIAILQIVNVINCDLINVALGILTLVFLEDPEVKAYWSAAPAGAGAAPPPPPPGTLPPIAPGSAPAPPPPVPQSPAPPAPPAPPEPEEPPPAEEPAVEPDDEPEPEAPDDGEPKPPSGS